MQSMIKREVSISITAHSEFIRQMILDGLEVAKFRTEKYSTSHEHHLKGSAIYYRNMRQNGHSTALRTIFSSPDFDEVGLISIFLNTDQRNHFIRKVENRSKVEQCLFIEKSVVDQIEKLRGQKIEVLILNDYVSIGAIKQGWELVEILRPYLLDLKLVVFLG